jgi:hypothetical protein
MIIVYEDKYLEYRRRDNGCIFIVYKLSFLG